MKKVIVLLSGGLDSSFAAYILKKSGYHITGLVLKITDDFPDETDIHNLKVLQKKLNIKILFKDVRHEFNEKIVKDFIETYKMGHTPNPCALCNPMIKFYHGFRVMRESGFDFVASGHYADKGYYKNHLTLKMARDKTKTQEYFLARLPVRYIKNILFPLAGYTKKYIKEEAHRIFPDIIPRGESQDICFLRGMELTEFLEKHRAVIHGNMVYKNEIVKRDINILSFTRGQRRGIDFAAGHRVYVKNINVNLKAVEIGEKDELMVNEFTIKNPIFYLPRNLIKKCYVRVRYSKKAAPCTLQFKDPDLVKVFLNTPLYTVTLGQLAVFYRDEYVLGSGWINSLI